MLSIVALNVNGLISKLNTGIIDVYLKSYDVICLSETLSDSVDLSNSYLHDFECYNLSRSSEQKFGGFHGMCILMKKHIYAYSERLYDTTSPSVIWVKFQRELLGYEFILGAVYLPCEGSIYHSIEVFDCLVQDIINIKSKFNAPFCLVGDFNARTGLLADYLDNDDNFVSDLLGLNSCDDSCLSPTCTDKLFVPTGRKNMDIKVNNNGSHVIDLCKCLGLAIVNGRLGDDNGIGNFTCFNKNGGCSTIDYAIVSHELFFNIQNFQVDLFDKCLSDVHCPIIMTLQSKHTHNQELVNDGRGETQSNTICDSSKPRYMSFKWGCENVNEYSDRLHSLTLQLSGIMKDIHGNASQELVDHCYSEICNSFLQAAQDIGVCKWKQSKLVQSSKEQHKVNSSSQVWFDAECDAARKEYLNLRNRLSRKIQLGKRLGVQVSDIGVLQSEFHLTSKKYKKIGKVQKEEVWQRF